MSPELDKSKDGSPGDFGHDSEGLVKNSALYREFLAEREEILKHKWIESEKLGRDIGFEKALLDWIVKHRAAWRRNRAQHQQAAQSDRKN
ncbi:MAG: hypothetical protein SFY92_04055 [Verrucomicrobiae bacterium]|nr:hypothetical protein [Verrucomicrobiae bacterium]